MPHEARVVQEEIFGPVELVFEWSDYEEMMALANDVDFGLAACVVTDDLDTAHRVAHDIEAGNVWVNQHNDFLAGHRRVQTVRYRPRDGQRDHRGVHADEEYKLPTRPVNPVDL